MIAGRRKPALFSVRPREKDESEVRWLISYSDFMMQLVCLFILLYSASNLDPAKANEVVRHYRLHVGLDEPIRTTAEGLEGPHAAADERSLAGGEPGRADLPRGLRFTIADLADGWQADFEGPLFRKGSAEFLPGAREGLDGVAGRLRDYVGTATAVATSDAGDGDPLPLAQARAEAVVAHLSREGFAGALDPRSLGASGRAAAGDSDVARVRLVFRRR